MHVTNTCCQVVDDIAKGAGMLDGVTITGGEPTLQPTFVAAVSSMLKADPRTRDLHRLLDSNGVVPPDVWDQLLPHVDGVAISIKAGSAEAYERVTGRKDCLPAVRQTLQSLHERGKLLEVCVPGSSCSSFLKQPQNGGFRNKFGLVESGFRHPSPDPWTRHTAPPSPAIMTGSPSPRLFCRRQRSIV